MAPSPTPDTAAFPAGPPTAHEAQTVCRALSVQPLARQLRLRSNGGDVLVTFRLEELTAALFEMAGTELTLYTTHEEHSFFEGDNVFMVAASGKIVFQEYRLADWLMSQENSTSEELALVVITATATVLDFRDLLREARSEDERTCRFRAASWQSFWRIACWIAVIVLLRFPALLIVAIPYEVARTVRALKTRKQAEAPEAGSWDGIDPHYWLARIASCISVRRI